MAASEEIPLFKVFMAPPHELDGPVCNILHSGYITQGKKVEEFEDHLRRFFGNVRAQHMDLILRTHARRTCTAL